MDNIQKEDFYQKAFNLSPDAINISRASDGMFVSVNEGFCRITGYTREEVIGKTSAEINLWADPDDRKKLTDALESDGKVYDLEAKFRMKNGEVVYGILSAVLLDFEGVPHILSLARDITDSKKIENALKESETRYRELIELSPDGILLLSNPGLIIGANTRMLNIAGRSLEELIGSPIKVLFSPEELVKVPLRFHLLQIGETVRRERNLTRPDGSVLPVEMHTKMMPDSSFQVVFHDISVQRHSENELRKLSRAVEQSPVSVVITDITGTIEYVNPKLCESTGYTKEELIGENPRIWSSHEKPSEEYREFWATIKSGLEWKGEFHNRKKNGEPFWESASVSAVKNDKNEITHFIGFKEDITHRKLLEEKILSSEQRYREMFLNNPIPAFIFYEDTLDFIEVNDAAVNSYGYSREEFGKMKLRDIRPPEDYQELLDSLKSTGSGIYHSTTRRHVKKNGQQFPVEITSHALPEKNGRKSRLVMVIDITERLRADEKLKLAKEKAEASDRLKTTFLNNISHEVRTPLNGIMGFVDLINQTNLTDNVKKNSVMMLVESSNRLLNTITNYMDISLLTSGSMTISNKDFSPPAVMREIFNNYERRCVERNLKLVLDIPADYENLRVNSDSEIFQKVFSHLLDNAIKFSASGTISFGLKNTEGQLEFFVKDDGLGISKELQESIFIPFHKGVHLSTSQSQGSGLGLSIAKGMIELMGGSISVKSQTGRGSIFTFTIPSWNESMKILVSDGAVVTKKTQKNPLILVAEDDETNFFYLHALLKFETTARILHASNGKEAIDMFRKYPDISLILMDVKMPEVDGLEATRKIKEINTEVPIIAITAYSMSGDKERVLAAGCDGYVSKPINKKNLLEKMEEFLDLRPV